MMCFLVICSQRLKFKTNNNAIKTTTAKNSSQTQADKDSHIGTSNVQVAVSSFASQVLCLLSAFSQLWTFFPCYSKTALQKPKCFEIAFLGFEIPDHITITFMYSVATSPLAKQRGTTVEVDETNIEFRQDMEADNAGLQHSSIP